MSSTIVQTGGCPLPPPDFNSLQLPAYSLNLASMDLLRIHARKYSPVFYARKSASRNPYRFDAANDEFGVLYAATQFGTCFAETVLRETIQGPHGNCTVDESQLEELCISRLGTSKEGPLLMADMTGNLVPFRGDNRIVSSTDQNYAIPNLWSSAIYGHPQNFDGIIFRSRFTNDLAVAIFSRTEIIAKAEPIPLLKSVELGSFLDENNIALITGSADWRE